MVGGWGSGDTGLEWSDIYVTYQNRLSIVPCCILTYSHARKSFGDALLTLRLLLRSPLGAVVRNPEHLCNLSHDHRLGLVKDSFCDSDTKTFYQLLLARNLDEDSPHVRISPLHFHAGCEDSEGLRIDSSELLVSSPSFSATATTNCDTTTKFPERLARLQHGVFYCFRGSGMEC